MSWLFAALCVLWPALVSACEFPVADWRAFPPPADRGSVPFMLWEHAANASRRAWTVYRAAGAVCARALDESRREAPALPFAAQVAAFSEARAALEVPDGWLVGFNRGEWGGALYWFSSDGNKRYKISDHPIVAIVRMGSGVLTPGCGSSSP
jgi:hypothetical protein